MEYFLYGGDYNPEQWLDQKDTVWKEDMLRAKEAGINCLSVGIFSWSFLEPEDGVYDFSFLDDVMDMLHENGIKAILATPSGARPVWMVDKYPSVLRADKQRLPYSYGGRHNGCVSSPDFRRKVKAINTELAKRYAKHPALIAWHVSNEYNNDCHCPNCQKAFQAWLKKRYGTIENLNRCWWNGFWSHKYDDFSQIESPSTPLWNAEWESPAHNIAWRRFCSDQIVDFFNMECEPLREYTPGIPVTANMMHTFPGIDYFKLGRAMDIASWDNYPEWRGDARDTEVCASSDFRHDLMRGTGDQKPFLMMESCPGTVNWMDHNTLRVPGTIVHQGLQAIAHGSDSVQYFQFRAGRGGSEQFHGSVLPPDGNTDSRSYREICATSDALRKIAEMKGTLERNRVALVYDWDSRWALDYVWMAHKGSQNYEGTVMAHYTALMNAGIGVDVVDQLSDLAPYDALVVPMGFMLRDGFAEKCKAFADRGGKVVFTYMSGYLDEEGLRYTGPNPLLELTGVRTDEIDAIDDTRTNSFLWKGKEYAVWEMAQLCTLRGAEAEAVYQQHFYAGMPVLTSHAWGKGRCYTVQARTGVDFLTDLYADLFAEHVILTGLPAGVTVTERFGKDARYLCVENTNHRDVSLTLDKQYMDLLSGETVSGEYLLKDFAVVFLKEASYVGTGHC